MAYNYRRTQTKQESQKGAWKGKIWEDMNRRHSGKLEKRGLT